MQVRKFEAPTMNEALKIIKQELGPDAIILSTKNHRKGFGLLSKASVEVTAAVSEKNLSKKQLTEKILDKPSQEQVKSLPARQQAKVYDDFNSYYESKGKAIQEDRRSREEIENLKKKVNSRPGRYIDIKDDDNLNQKEMEDILLSRNEAGGKSTSVINNQSSFDGGRFTGRQMGGASDTQNSYMSGAQLNPALQLSNSAMEQRSQNQAHLTGSTPASVSELKDDVKRLKMMLEELKSEQIAIADTRIVETGSDELNHEFQNLVRNGIEKKYAVQLLKQAGFSLSRQDHTNQAKIVESIAVEMMQNLRVENFLDFQPGDQQRVYAIVGPTGVGKTTTLAKIAAQAILNRNLRVGLINVDSYKVAASDQLATYAKILNVPFRLASTAQELERALSEFKPLDLVLIDTAGRSQKDSESLAAMKALLDGVAHLKSILIMSATTRDQDLYDILNRFRVYHPSGIAFSKLDEASVFGCIYNIAVKSHIPLAYFTVGQRVPEDIESASKERVVDLILDL